MIFNSVTYLLFLVVVVILFWILPRHLRLVLVFCASIVFYGFWRIEFIPLMMTSAVIDYTAAIQIAGARSKTRKRAWLVLSLVANLGLLFYFKYLIFFTENTVRVANVLGASFTMPSLDIILPLGISFYTFQTISYTIDVYRGFIEPERSFIRYGSYVTFFPQLVAGPILRAREVIPQFVNFTAWSWRNIEEGLRRICYGLFLKVALADNISPIVDGGFSNSTSLLGGLDVLTLAFLFGFQIYFDFAAYSHIAIGSARLLGVKFPENFNFPYMSSSPKEFWQRWHISLSSWIRDYLYLPLTGSKVLDRSTGGLANVSDNVVPKNRDRALFVTWFIMGLWHGANWTFALWGIYHAVLIFSHRLIRGFRERLPLEVRTYGGWFVMLPLAMIGWIPFRAGSVSDAIDMFATLFVPSSYATLGLRENDYLVAAALLIGHVGVYQFKEYVVPYLTVRQTLQATLNIGFIAFQVATIFVFLRPIQQFIYFQF